MIKEVLLLLILVLPISGRGVVKYVRSDDFLTGKRVLEYAPLSVIDGNTTTSWAYNTQDKRSRIALRFTNFIPIDEVRVYSGYQRSDTTWASNRRPREVRLFLARENRTKFDPFRGRHVGDPETRTNLWWTNVVLEDVRKAQVFTFRPIVVNEFLFRVLSTYPGTHYDNTHMSEIEFWYRGVRYEVANLDEAKREFVSNYKSQVLRILIGDERRRSGYSFAWWFGLSTITFEKTGHERGNFWIAAFLDPRRALITNRGQVREGDTMGTTNISGEWRFDENGVFWTRVRGRSWKATDVSAVAQNRLGQAGLRYFGGSDIETGYFDWTGPDEDVEH